jgi:hypothetical protein
LNQLADDKFVSVVTYDCCCCTVLASDPQYVICAYAWICVTFLQVTLKQPVLVEQLKLDDTDESLVSAALELAGVTTSAATTATDTTTAGTAGTTAVAPSPAHNTASSATATTAANAATAASTVAAATTGGVLKVVQSELGKTVWIVRVLPHSEQRVPFEYTVEWPADKEITVE